MNEAFKEKDDKYRDWATLETREKKVSKVVMVPLIISHDGAVHQDTERRWIEFAPDIIFDWVRMAQNVLRYNVVIVDKFGGLWRPGGSQNSNYSGGTFTFFWTLPPPLHSDPGMDSGFTYGSYN